MKFKILKFEYLKNGKNFWKEIENIFPSFESALFKTYKQNSTNIPDRTFNGLSSAKHFEMIDDYY